MPDAPKEFPSNLEAAVSPVAEEATIEVLAKLAAGIPIEELGGTGGETPPVVRKRDDELTQEDRETLIEKIGHMSVVEKVKAALTGNLESRSLLIRDSNKLVSRAVFQSPKLSETEVEGYAAAKNVSDEVLRMIGASRKWMKSYVVVRALVNNPRAPIDVTMRLVLHLNDKDMKGLSLNRNVPDVIRTMALKAIKQKEDSARGKRRGSF
jgi:CRISPR/Cas system-associated endonuclease Cas3-HD